MAPNSGDASERKDKIQIDQYDKHRRVLDEYWKYGILRNINRKSKTKQYTIDTSWKVNSQIKCHYMPTLDWDTASGTRDNNMYS